MVNIPNTGNIAQLEPSPEELDHSHQFSTPSLFKYIEYGHDK